MALRFIRINAAEIPHTDPFDRQITIGLGCFFEPLVIAASADGYTVDLTLFPEGSEGPITRAVIASGAKADPLSSASCGGGGCGLNHAAILMGYRCIRLASVYRNFLRWPGIMMRHMIC